MRGWSRERQLAAKAKQGWPFIFQDLRIVNDAGAELPMDGKACGELQARGAHTVKRYLKVPIFEKADITLLASMQHCTAVQSTLNQSMQNALHSRQGRYLAQCCASCCFKSGAIWDLRPICKAE